MRTDKMIKEDILDALDWEPSVDAADIGVIVDDGVVTLTGHVDSYFKRMAAERVARKIKGVKAIAQEIEVRLPTDDRISDDRIAAKIIDIVEWDVAIPEGSVQPEVRNGIVTLTGETDWQYQRLEVVDRVQKLRGVVSVINNIKIKPRTTPREIEREIRRALHREADFESQQIHVNVDGSTVRLTGALKSLAERDAVEDAAWSAPGVTEVVDNIAVVH